MFRKKKIILSYDYELFFGDQSGTVEKTLIEPTDKMMAAMESVGARGNFFIDYLMFKYLEQNQDERSIHDLDLLKNQVRDMVKRGHRIELHLHPHWVDAKYNGDGTWDYSDYTHYMLSTFSVDEIRKMFIEGVSYLESLVKEVDASYKIVAFRAGGWAVQPFSKLKQAFLDAGIVVDSSSAFGAYNPKTDQCYDFRNMPNKTYYWYEDDVCREHANGYFLEVPISSYKRNILHVIADKIFQCLGKKQRLTDGTHIRSNDPAFVEMIKKSHFLKKIFGTTRTMLSFSQTATISVFTQIFFSKKNLLCSIDHPKDLSGLTIPGIKVAGRLCNSMFYKDLLIIERNI